MKRHLRQLWVIAVLAAPALANHPAKSVGAEERARIDAASAPALGSMRAGRDQDPKTMLSSERSALRSAEAQTPNLGQMRGGIDTVEVLLIVLLVVVILILI